MYTRQLLQQWPFQQRKKKECGREGNQYIVLNGNRKSKGVHKWINCRTVTVNDCVHLFPCCTSTVSILSLITTYTCTWLPQQKDRRTRHSSDPASAQCLLLRVGGETERWIIQWLLRAPALNMIYFYFDYSHSLDFTYYLIKHEFRVSKRDFRMFICSFYLLFFTN